MTEREKLIEKIKTKLEDESFFYKEIIIDGKKLSKEDILNAAEIVIKELKKDE